MGRLQNQSPVQGVHWFVVGKAGTMDSSEGCGGQIWSTTNSTLQGRRDEIGRGVSYMWLQGCARERKRKGRRWPEPARRREGARGGAPGRGEDRARLGMIWCFWGSIREEVVWCESIARHGVPLL